MSKKAKNDSETVFKNLQDPSLEAMALERLRHEFTSKFSSLKELLENAELEEKEKKDKVHQYYGSFLAAFLLAQPEQVLALIKQLKIKLVPGVEVKDPDATFKEILTKLRAVNCPKNLKEGIVRVNP